MAFGKEQKTMRNKRARALRKIAARISKPNKWIVSKKGTHMTTPDSFNRVYRSLKRAWRNKPAFRKIAIKAEVRQKL